MSPEALLKDLKQKFGEFLKEHPEEKNNSTGFVCKNLELHHMKAAIYMDNHNSVRLDAYNLHDLIVNWDQYKAIAEFSPDDMVIHDAAEIEPGAFHPKHLIGYFKSLKTAN